ncbi:hypothetical protein BASA50_010014 [Batrachochytrium salamandrivorans]|uniref:non-specific serine/threonine protein kinase n=1 Tax=Batrachochytrium salamandrivorans TaxID=1357716 RepID=A0ABQ8EZP7_9FUNG|nr:hypothetical protein BASA50_010014 [Batrachochytrium salamandrivorans]
MTSLYRSVIFLLSVAAIQVQGGKNDLNQPESQPPTLQADSSSVRPKLLRPTRLTQKELVHQLKEEKKEEVEYSKFIECESKYLETEYNYVKEPGTSKYGDDIQVATTKSDGHEVLLKTIEKKDVDFYQLESTSSLKMHMAEIGSEDGRYTSRECKLPEPLNLLLPYEVEVQKYLTQSGYYGSPHVLEVVDYAVRENEYVLVMDHPGEGWMALDKYTREEGKLSVVEIRLIIREVLKALLSLKSLGVVHGNIAARNILYNEETSKLKLMNFGYSGPLEKWNEDSSAKKPSDEKPDFWSTEEIDLVGLGKLMYHLVTLEDANQHPMTRQEVQEKLRKSMDNPKFQSAIDLMDLVPILLDQGPYKMATLKDALRHPFFSR